jgi:hypothetical protein
LAGTYEAFRRGPAVVKGQWIGSQQKEVPIWPE